jgi:hypothetical protein
VLAAVAGDDGGFNMRVHRSQTPRRIQTVQTEWFVGTIAVHNVTTGRQDEGVNVTEGTVAVPGVTCLPRAWILRDAQARL